MSQARGLAWSFMLVLQSATIGAAETNGEEETGKDMIKRCPGKHYVKCITCSGSGSVYAGIGVFKPCANCRGYGWVKQDPKQQVPVAIEDVTAGVITHDL